MTSLSFPAWNEALATLGARYVPVENDRVAEQTQAHLEESKLLLRALARHIAVEADQPELFHQIEEVSQGLEADPEWSTLWWHVPFATVLEALRTGYADVPEIGCHLDVIAGARTMDDLRAGFQRHGVEVDPDPYEIAGRNRDRLGNMILHIHDLHRTWLELGASDGTPAPPPSLPARLHATA